MFAGLPATPVWWTSQTPKARDRLTHPFYQKTPRAQRHFQWKLAGWSLAVLAVCALLGYATGVVFIPLAGLYLTLILLAPFIDTPAMVRSGRLTYHSLMLLAEKEHHGKVQLHGGTLLDYWFVLRPMADAQRRKTFILQQFAEGLLHFMDAHAAQEGDDLVVRATTHILQERTARRLGFAAEKRDALQVLILLFNYPNLMATKCMAEKRLSWPRVGMVRSYSTTLAQVRSQREVIKRLNQQLRRRLEE